MSNNTPRDKQFRDGFARLLFGDLMMMDALNYDCNLADIEQHLARRGYDLVRHASESIGNKQVSAGVLLHPNAMMREVTDMTEWPKESEDV